MVDKFQKDCSRKGGFGAARQQRDTLISLQEDVQTEPTGWVTFSVFTLANSLSVCFTLKFTCVCVRACVGCWGKGQVFPKLGRLFKNNYMDNFSVWRRSLGKTSVYD